MINAAQTSDSVIYLVILFTIVGSLFDVKALKAYSILSKSKASPLNIFIVRINPDATFWKFLAFNSD